MTLWQMQDWERNAREKWYDPQKDTPVDLKPPVYGWLLATQGRWQIGHTYTTDVESNPYEYAYRIYEHIYDAIENLAPFCERVEMTQVVRMRLSGKVYRPAKRSCPYRAYHGTTLTPLWEANPTAVFHEFALLCIEDILKDYPHLETFVEAKQQYLDGHMTWQALYSITRKLGRLKDALGPDGRYAVYQTLLSLRLEYKDTDRLETRLQEMLVTLRPKGIVPERLESGTPDA